MKIVGMTNITDEKVKEFISLFDGDVLAAQAAISEYSYVPVHSPALPEISPDDAIISLQNVSKSYCLGRRTVRALSDVSVAIGKGEFVAITGASGSGKSTLLHMIGCLDKPTTGAVAIEGRQTTELGDGALSRLRQKSIGFIFQSFYLQPFLRLSDNLAVPAMFTNQKKKNVNARVDQLLGRVGLVDRATHLPKELSGGQIQRAAIARALTNSPRIILADEPTGNLDSANSQSIVDLFKAIRDKLGTTVVVVTHDPNIARQADRIIRLKDGAIV